MKAHKPFGNIIDNVQKPGVMPNHPVAKIVAEAAKKGIDPLSRQSIAKMKQAIPKK